MSPINDYHRTRLRRDSPAVRFWRAGLVIGSIILVLILGQALLSSEKSELPSVMADENTNAGSGSSTAADENTNASDTSGPAEQTNASATNTNTAGTGNALSTKDCATPISQFGTAKKSHVNIWRRRIAHRTDRSEKNIERGKCAGLVLRLRNMGEE